MTPSAKKSTGKEWLVLQMTSGAIYPGVPLVSSALLGFVSLETPRSVTLKYPRSSRTRFSGLRSRWMTRRLCMYCRAKTIHPRKKRVSSSLNLRRVPKWYLNKGVITWDRHDYNNPWRGRGFPYPGRSRPCWPGRDSLIFAKEPVHSWLNARTALRWSWPFAFPS